MSVDDYLGTEIIRGNVLPEWIDVNKHMNVAYYVLAFDLAIDSLWERIGITPDHVKLANSSTFAVESHITYQQELVEGDPYFVTSQVLAYDDKRIHQFQRLYHAEKKFLAATAEWMNLHVDLQSRRVSPWPDSILSKLAEYAAGQVKQAYPEEAGKQMNIGRPIYMLKREL